jgi:hypothetical protein
LPDWPERDCGPPAGILQGKIARSKYVETTIISARFDAIEQEARVAG